MIKKVLLHKDIELTIILQWQNPYKNLCRLWGGLYFTTIVPWIFLRWSNLTQQISVFQQLIIKSSHTSWYNFVLKLTPLLYKLLVSMILIYNNNNNNLWLTKIKVWTKLTFLLKRRDGREIWKKNGTVPFKTIRMVSLLLAHQEFLAYFLCFEKKNKTRLMRSPWCLCLPPINLWIAVQSLWSLVCIMAPEPISRRTS
jgi:hypothetical protein